MALLASAASAFGFGGCRKHEPAPAPSASASAPSGFADGARASHFDSEVKRSAERWTSKPRLDECTKVLHEPGDAELCGEADRSLTALEQLEASAPPERWLTALSDGSLTLARLSQRARYQSLVEIGKRHVTGDAGAPPIPKSAPSPPVASAALRSGRATLGAMPEPHTIELTESPAAAFVPIVLRLERDTLRHIAAYLEYAPLAQRKLAFGFVKKLSQTRPQWPLLERMIHEAALLEPDAGLKLALNELAASGLPRDRVQLPDQPKVSK